MDEIETHLDTKLKELKRLVLSGCDQLQVSQVWGEIQLIRSECGKLRSRSSQALKTTKESSSAGND